MTSQSNAPTEKQINFILKLSGGSREWDAFHQIAKTIGCSASAATKRATMAHASATIERLLQERDDNARAKKENVT